MDLLLLLLHSDAVTSLQHHGRRQLAMSSLTLLS